MIEPRDLTDQQFAEVLKHLPAEHHALAWIARTSELTVEEAMLLQWADFDLETGVLTVPSDEEFMRRREARRQRCGDDS